MMELGLYTFGDLVPDPHTGKPVSARERMRQMLELARLADEAGLDLLGVGEHHALQYVDSATATILSAMAAITKRIRLTSASTSLSTADPVRTFQEFATADLVSQGRVEIIFGRGAFTDNFPLFGFDLANDDALFIEKLGLFAQLKPLFNGPMPPPVFAPMISPHGALVAGSVQEVIDKILLQHEAIGTTRFLGQIDVGGQPFADVIRGLELFATRVAPVLRKATS